MPKAQTPPLPTLPMQMMLTLGCWLSSPFALRCAKNGLPPLKDSIKSPPPELSAALAEEARSRTADLLKGILGYMDAPYARTMREPPCIWQQGNTRVLDYGA